MEGFVEGKGSIFRSAIRTQRLHDLKLLLNLDLAGSSIFHHRHGVEANRLAIKEWKEPFWREWGRTFQCEYLLASLNPSGTHQPLIYGTTLPDKSPPSAKRHTMRSFTSSLISLYPADFPTSSDDFFQLSQFSPLLLSIQDKTRFQIIRFKANRSHNSIKTTSELVTLVDHTCPLVAHNSIT